MRHICNLETVKTYEGTDHIHALVIGERVTSKTGGASRRINRTAMRDEDSGRSAARGRAEAEMIEAARDGARGSG